MDIHKTTGAKMVKIQPHMYVVLSCNTKKNELGSAHNCTVDQDIEVCGGNILENNVNDKTPNIEVGWGGARTLFI